MTSIVGKFLFSIAGNIDQQGSFSYFSPFYGKDMINVMRWSIKKVSTHSHSINLCLY